MMTLADLVREAETFPYPWDDGIESYHTFESRKPPKRHLQSVASFLSGCILRRMLGRVPRGALAELLSPRLERQLEHPTWTDSGANRNSAAVSAALLTADGWTMPDACRPTLERCIRGPVETDYQWAHVERGLCAIFFDIDAAWREEITASDPFGPGRRFGPDLRAMVAYIGNAQAAGAGLDAIEPALDSFLQLRDTLSHGGAVRLETLAMIGVVAGHSVGGVPVTDVLSWWGERLRAHLARSQTSAE